MHQTEQFCTEFVKLLQEEEEPVHDKLFIFSAKTLCSPSHTYFFYQHTDEAQNEDSRIRIIELKLYDVWYRSLSFVSHVNTSEVDLQKPSAWVLWAGKEEWIFRVSQHYIKHSQPLSTGAICAEVYSQHRSIQHGSKVYFINSLPTF